MALRKTLQQIQKQFPGGEQGRSFGHKKGDAAPRWSLLVLFAREGYFLFHCGRKLQMPVWCGIFVRAAWSIVECASSASGRTGQLVADMLLFSHNSVIRLRVVTVSLTHTKGWSWVERVIISTTTPRWPSSRSKSMLEFDFISFFKHLFKIKLHLEIGKSSGFESKNIEIKSNSWKGLKRFTYAKSYWLRKITQHKNVVSPWNQRSFKSDDREQAQKCSKDQKDRTINPNDSCQRVPICKMCVWGVRLDRNRNRFKREASF